MRALMLALISFNQVAIEMHRLSLVDLVKLRRGRNFISTLYPFPDDAKKLPIRNKRHIASSIFFSSFRSGLIGYFVE